MSKFSILIFGGMILFTSQASRAQVVRGVVLDRMSLESIPAATISAPFSKATTVAANDGVFEISVAGDSVLVISAVGYETDTVPVSSRHLQVYLLPDKTSLGEVVVTGTLRPVLKSASPVPVEIYTPKFFMKNPTPTIFDALQLVNGVRPQLNCNVCNTGDIHINGLEGPYTMVLIDGMPIVSSLASVYGLSGIPNSLVERIEIVKGPASSLYGSEAIGGLINVITKNPMKASVFSADFSSTTWGEHNLDVATKYRIGKATALLGINYFNYSRPVDYNNDNFTDVTLQDRVSIFNKISWHRKNNRAANLGVRYVYEDRWGGEMNWSRKHRGGDQVYGENIYTSRAEVMGNYQLPSSEKLMFSYSLNSHSQNSAYGTSLFDAKQRIAFGQLTWDKKLRDNHALLLGIAARFTHYDDNTTATQDTLTKTNRPDRIFLPGVFAQGEVDLDDEKQLLVGMRYDYNRRHGHIFTPRLAFKWSPTKIDVFRVNAGTGFRVVNLFTEDHAALTGAREVVVQDELRPERSYNVNVNYTRKIYSSSWWMNIDFSSWYTYFNNRIVPDYVTNPNLIIYRNLEGHAVSKGVSSNIEMGFTNSLRGTLGFSVMDVSLIDKDSEGKRVKQQQLLTEKWAATWTVSYTIRPFGLAVDYTGNLYGPMLLPLVSDLDPRPSKSPVWSIQNIQLSKKLSQRWELYAGIKNLLNWTPAKHIPFLIARSHDPFDKSVHYDQHGQVVVTAENPFGLTFDPTYVYAANQGLRGFFGVRFAVK